MQRFLSLRGTINRNNGKYHRLILHFSLFKPQLLRESINSVFTQLKSRLLWCVPRFSTEFSTSVRLKKLSANNRKLVLKCLETCSFQRQHTEQQHNYKNRNLLSWRSRVMESDCAPHRRKLKEMSSGTGNQCYHNR